MSSLIAIELAHLGVSLTGQMAKPAGDGPFPAVLVMHNALGIGDHVREVAQRLAALGYVAVASDMFGGGGSAGDQAINGASYEAVMKDPALLRARVIAWFDRVAAMPQVRADRVAAIGFCFGGACVLELARSGADVRGVVTFHGGLSTTKPAKAGDIKARILVCHGGADSHVNAEVPVFKAEMEKAKAQMEFITYEGAQHGFTKPGPAYQKKADEDSWAAMKRLFAEILK